MGAQEVVGYFLLGAFPIFELSCYQIMRSNRSDIAIRKRNVTMIHICTIAGWLAYVNLIISIFGGIYCGVYHMFVIMLPPLSVGPQLLRGITLWGMLEHNKLMLDYGETAHLKRTSTLHAIREASSSVDEEAMSSTIEGQGSGRHQTSTKAKAIQVRQTMKKIVKATKVFLVGLPVVLIITMLVVSDKEMLLKNEFDQCFPEPDLILNIGRVFSIAFTAATFIITVLVRHCNDELGIHREITRNVVILFVTNVIIFITRHQQEYRLLTLIYTMQQMLLSFSMIVIPCCFSSEASISLVSYLKKNTGVPGYGKSIPNVQSGRSSVRMSLAISSQRGFVMNKEREREISMSLDAGLCILLSSIDGIKAFSEHCSREFR